MNYIFSVYWILIAAVWNFIMGLLHDIFVIKNHKGPYNRELLRLLMDGHVLIFSGITLGICFMMFRDNSPYASLVTLTVGLGMLVYCTMIFPFLKSYVTMFINLIVTIIAVKGSL